MRVFDRTFGTSWLAGISSVGVRIPFRKDSIMIIEFCIGSLLCFLWPALFEEQKRWEFLVWENFVELKKLFELREKFCVEGKFQVSCFRASM
jgi:hypothetical protein